ncbi:hypothetical protein ACJX0J_012438, partial [Zea mays]
TFLNQPTLVKLDKLSVPPFKDGAARRLDPSVAQDGRILSEGDENSKLKKKNIISKLTVGNQVLTAHNNKAAAVDHWTTPLLSKKKFDNFHKLNSTFIILTPKKDGADQLDITNAFDLVSWPFLIEASGLYNNNKNLVDDSTVLALTLIKLEEGSFGVVSGLGLGFTDRAAIGLGVMASRVVDGHVDQFRSCTF